MHLLWIQDKCTVNEKCTRLGIFIVLCCLVTAVSVDIWSIIIPLLPPTYKYTHTLSLSPSLSLHTLSRQQANARIDSEMVPQVYLQPRFSSCRHSTCTLPTHIHTCTCIYLAYVYWYMYSVHTNVHVHLCMCMYMCTCTLLLAGRAVC